MSERVRSGRHRQSVLVVDDDHAVATVMGEWLRKAGYEVTVCHASRDAVTVARERREAIDILVIDVMLPGMSGPVLAGALRRIHPESAVLFTSGYSPELVAEISAPHTTNAVVLRKPFVAEELLAKMTLAMARRPRTVDLPAPESRPGEVEDPPETVAGRRN